MRYRLVLTIFLGLMVGCGDDGGVETEENGDTFVPDETPMTLGVCFMGGDPCVMTYVDLGPYEDAQKSEADMQPAYVFPAVPENDGGSGNPLDPQGLYQPYRLQNNVFAGPGRVWTMWLVYSADLNLMAEPVPGVRIWGVDADTTADFKDGNLRDLFTNPFRGEDEIRRLAEQGQIRLVNTRQNTDCPVIEARPQDTVIDLNPGFPFCEHSRAARQEVLP